MDEDPTLNGKDRYSPYLKAISFPKLEQLQ
jgi:hypothetical protein